MKQVKKPSDLNSKFNFCIFETGTKYLENKENKLDSLINVVPLNLSANAVDVAGWSKEIPLSNAPAYGKAAGLFYLWKNTSFDYYGFTLNNQIFDITPQDLDRLITKKKELLYAKPQFMSQTVQENYRSLYYSYDFRMFISILKKDYKLYHELSQKEFVDENSLIPPCVVMSKNQFRKFCVWAFSILEICNQFSKPKYSLFQASYFEHLICYILALYILYNKEKVSSEEIKDVVKLETDTTKEYKIPVGLSPKNTLQKLLDDRQLEEAINYVSSNDSPELARYKKVMDRYERERRYYKTTFIESCHNLDELISYPESVKKPEKKANILVLKWNSISHDETLLAFETLGLTYECFDFGDIFNCRNERTMDGLNYYLDTNAYDCVFSINYFHMAAEACFIHDTPYIAWTYDSPVALGYIGMANYPTTNIFLFDSKETKRYSAMGYKNVHYLPLAVNVDKYDKISCTPDDLEKYGASISFVGSLYNTKLNEAMRSLPDYKKAYLNALVDNSLVTPNFNLFKEILTPSFMEFLSDDSFNKRVNEEANERKLDYKATSELPPPGTLDLLLKKTVTYRERLLIISMLSNHFDFKLYSYSSHEVFKNVIECGSVNYYTEMPKVFKCSKLNLNMTLRTIETGIPLRCLDIMGCKGALLTNHQLDFDEHFVDGKNIIYYTQIPEALEKAQYYLSHEDELGKLALAGYETVKEHYNYPVLLKKILVESGLKNLVNR